MFSAGVEAVAAGILRERMPQQGAFRGIARLNEKLPDLEILSRLLVGPFGRSGGEGLQRRTAVVVTGHAASVAGALLQKDGLHALFEERVVRCGGGLREQRGGNQENSAREFEHRGL